MLRRIFISVISCLLILLFLYTAVSKLVTYNSFRHIMSVSPLVGSKPTAVVNISNPTTVTTIICITLLICMIWMAALILMPKTRLLGFCGAVLILLTITLYLGYVVYFVSIEDYPFSGMERPRLGYFSMTWKQLLVFNVCFLLLSLTGILLQTKMIVREKQSELQPVVFT